MVSRVLPSYSRNFLISIISLINLPRVYPLTTITFGPVFVCFVIFLIQHEIIDLFLVLYKVYLFYRTSFHSRITRLWVLINSSSPSKNVYSLLGLKFVMTISNFIYRTRKAQRKDSKGHTTENWNPRGRVLMTYGVIKNQSIMSL